MKKALLISFLLLFCLIIAFLISISGCDGSPQEAREIGREYTGNGYSEKVELDKENERLVFTHKYDDASSSCGFGFGFTCETTNTLSVYDRSAQKAGFMFTDSDGKEIEFDDYGYYWFSGSKVLYIYYKNTDQDIKKAIDDGKFSVDFGSNLYTIYKNSSENNQ